MAYSIVSQPARIEASFRNNPLAFRFEKSFSILSDLLVWFQPTTQTIVNTGGFISSAITNANQIFFQGQELFFFDTSSVYGSQRVIVTSVSTSLVVFNVAYISDLAFNQWSVNRLNFQAFLEIFAGYPSGHPNFSDFPNSLKSTLSDTHIVSGSLSIYKFNLSGIIQSLFNLQPPSTANGWQLLMPYFARLRFFKEVPHQQVTSGWFWATVGKELPYPHCGSERLSVYENVGIELHNRNDWNQEVFRINSRLNFNPSVAPSQTSLVVNNQILM